jgi:hypothetical protein
LKKVPTIRSEFSYGNNEKLWWVKFSIETTDQFSWKVVQELGHVFNYLSTEEPLPSIFYPVSPPPYMNGGPEKFLSWIIENTHDNFTPELATEWLEARLPDNVECRNQWKTE